MICTLYRAPDGKFHFSKRGTLEDANQDVSNNEGTILFQEEGDLADEEFVKEIEEFLAEFISENNITQVYKSEH